ncbi:unnamed protein product [Colias eurytheme]|nr:unnamed protein product [Colias eurytheme]
MTKDMTSYSFDPTQSISNVTTSAVKSNLQCPNRSRIFAVSTSKSIERKKCRLPLASVGGRISDGLVPVTVHGAGTMATVPMAYGLHSPNGDWAGRSLARMPDRE